MVLIDARRGAETAAICGSVRGSPCRSSGQYAGYPPA